MLIRVRRETIYRYAEPQKAAMQKLALTPRNYDGQRVLGWRIDVDHDCRLRACEDAFGNIAHSLWVEGPLEALTILVEGEVETFDTAGVVRGAVERFPPQLYLRETPQTEIEPTLRDFARAATATASDALSKLHALVKALHEAVLFDPSAPEPKGAAADALARRNGGGADLAHVFVACSRALDLPSRFVSGYALRAERAAEHCWAESLVGGLGWVGFDPAEGASPDESYVRVAVALDHLGAAPIRAARYGGGEETMEVRVLVARGQSQFQSQA
ncbi:MULTISPECIES: transglutaminase family protein [Methylosinus]|uniref:Transglutaminase family protein n=1 Tax=Methylosinus trichosporium (strain ATCC 35070 / NCIMB 11131 / UNIQEM 75 / OB3b) TaxID=595536 RepID=A0A2D2D2Q3_METT3|nr:MULTISPECIES: transglutaminase family protein [Methylosinus]ATQ69268.1 transglutaminase family protein [Methylosinus trichosporium OB3b]OBS53247.1 transglutaminase [Methylosinus sp. 3S-1]